jgi:hypothetical protein
LTSAQELPGTDGGNHRDVATAVAADTEDGAWQRLADVRGVGRRGAQDAHKWKHGGLGDRRA